MHRSYPRNLLDSPKARKILIGIIVVLVLIVIAQFAINRLSATSDTSIRYALNARLRQEINSAQRLSTQISLLGTSSTQRTVSETRQHLYAVQLLNELTASLMGAGNSLVPPDQVQAALTAITACEAQMQSGYGMEAPLDDLARAIDALLQSAQTLD
ncbi:MAG: hypothetical protein LBN04_09390 [Oscillospiraceae bacterium]|jgi:hypothetical protein|nr:hypothetical protein [Oscillospiraceae bacterium]